MVISTLYYYELRCHGAHPMQVACWQASFMFYTATKLHKKNERRKDYTNFLLLSAHLLVLLQAKSK